MMPPYKGSERNLTGNELGNLGEYGLFNVKADRTQYQNMAAQQPGLLDLSLIHISIPNPSVPNANAIRLFFIQNLTLIPVTFLPYYYLPLILSLIHI